MQTIKTICVYCGSNSGSRPEYINSAAALGRVIAGKKIELVFGGARVGLMGVIADAVISAGGRAVGVIPSRIADRVGHKNLSDIHIVDDMHQRKKMMFELSDAFIAMPGGLGTFEEIFEVLTWSQLGLHCKPCGLLNIQRYYDFLLKFLDHGVDQKFVSEVHRNMILITDSPEELIDMLFAYEPQSEDKWV